MDVINKIAAMSPPTSKKEAQTFLGVVGFWRMHIANYSQNPSPLYLLSLSVITVIIVICNTSSIIVKIIQIKEGWSF